MARSFIVYQGEDETPEYDLTDPLSPVHVIWEEIEAGGRAFQGESTTNSIPMRDERAETGNSQNLPSGLTLTSLSRGSRWEWMEGSVRMAAGRIGTKDYSRGRQKADRAREVTVQAADRNEELTEIIVDDWVRPEETDVARVLALCAAYLNGSPRSTTVLATTYVASGNTVTVPAKTYDGTNPKDILAEIAQLANKLFFVTIDDEVFYDTADSTVYQAGIRISDRLDELDFETVCSSGDTATVLASGGHAEDSTADSIDNISVPSGTGALYYALLTHDGVSVATASYFWGTGQTPVPMTLIGTVAHPTASSGENTDNETLYIYRLPTPTPSGTGAGIVVSGYSGTPNGRAHGYWAVDSTANATVVGATGTGTSSSVTPSAGAGDLVLDVMGWRIWSLGDASNDPSPTASQTEDWGMAFNNSPGQPDMAWGGGSKAGSGARTWSWSTSTNWVAAAIVISGSEPSEVATFPPIWDVGPSSTEDGLELVSGLRLYYGQDGAYVYVNHSETANEYWWAERSFYTQDPAINDETKATALANALLTRLRFEDRNYNVSIGPMGEEHVGCIKYGQLIDIKARAIPDADDQFRPRRIAQLKWSTPSPGVFFARMQLNRPIKAVPFGIGAKEGHDAIEQHKEGDAHPASAIVITDSGGYFTGNDVEAALQELAAASGADSNNVTPSADAPVTVTNDSANNSFPGLARMADGNLLLVYRAGTDHATTQDGVIVRKISTDDGATWGSASTIINPATDARDPEVTVLRDGTVIMSYWVWNGSNDGDLFSVRSTDNASTWDTPVAASASYTLDANPSKIVELPDGDLLMPGYGNDGSTGDYSAFVLRSTDGGDSWGSEVTIATGTIGTGTNWTEPYILRMTDGRLLCAIREEDDRDIFICYSSDDGATWTTPAKAFDGWGKPFLFETASGAIICITRTQEASELAIYRVSWDYGATWGPETTLEATGEMMTYASAVQVGERIIVAYGLEAASTNADIFVRDLLDVSDQRFSNESRLSVTEEDGSPIAFGVNELRFPASAVTVNADGSVSISAVTAAQIKDVGRWEPVVVDTGSGPELVFADGDIVMHWIDT